MGVCAVDILYDFKFRSRSCALTTGPMETKYNKFKVHRSYCCRKHGHCQVRLSYRFHQYETTKPIRAWVIL